MKANVFKKVTSMAVSAALVATMGISAFAATATSDTAIDISKKLDLAQGVTAANSFTFEFESDSTAAPEIADVVLDFTGAKDTDKDGSVVKTATVDFASQAWTTSGVYTYTITEKNDAASGVTYDSAKYTVVIGVKNGDDGGFVVTDVIVKDADGNKLDAGSKTVTDADTTDEDDAESPVMFGNSYTKVADSTPTDLEKADFDDRTTNPDGVTPDETPGAASLVITNDTTGDYGDEELPFSFDLDFTYPDTDPNPTGVQAYTVDADGVIHAVDLDDTITLADGEKLIVEGLPAGTTYNVVEKVSADDTTAKYTPSADATENGVADPTVTGEEGKDLDVAAGVGHDLLIGEKENGVDFTTEDTEDGVTPTGVVINNAPYILLGVIAAGGMTGYIYKRRRVED